MPTDCAALILVRLNLSTEGILLSLCRAPTATEMEGKKFRKWIVKRIKWWLKDWKKNLKSEMIIRVFYYVLQTVLKNHYKEWLVSIFLYLTICLGCSNQISFWTSFTNDEKPWNRLNSFIVGISFDLIEYKLHSIMSDCDSYT